MRPRLRVPRPHHRARAAAPAATPARPAARAPPSPAAPPGAPGGGGASGGDRRRPKLSLLRVRRSKGRLVASFRLSEAARVATRIDRAKKAKKRVRTRYRTTKRLAVRSLPAGKRKITLGRLKRGRLRIVLTARDTTGNRGSLTRAFRVK